jgi:hypothetical protein
MLFPASPYRRAHAPSWLAGIPGPARLSCISPLPTQSGDDGNALKIIPPTSIGSGARSVEGGDGDKK